MVPLLPEGIGRVVERCAWCRRPLGPDIRVVIAGGPLAESSPQVEALRGQVVRVRTSHARRRVRAIVPLPDTPAHYAGYDLLFVLCSIDCRDALDDAIGNRPMRVSADTATSSSSRPRPLPFRRSLLS